MTDPKLLAEPKGYEFDVWLDDTVDRSYCLIGSPNPERHVFAPPITTPDDGKIHTVGPIFVGICR